MKCTQCKSWKKNSQDFKWCRGVGNGNIEHQCKAGKTKEK